MKKTLLRILQVILYLFIAAAILLVPQIVVYYPMSWLLGSDFTHPAWTALYSILSYLLAAVLLIIMLRARARARTPASGEAHAATKIRALLGLTDLPKWSDIALAPIGFVLYTAFATILTGLFSKFSFFDAEEAQYIGFDSSLYFSSDKILVFIAVVIVAPIVEEIIFRGWLYAKLRAKIPGKASMLISILLTSILFGALHGQWNVGVNVFCLSVILCVLREITGTIHSGIILHILKNAIAFWLLYMI